MQFYLQNKYLGLLVYVSILLDYTKFLCVWGGIVTIYSFSSNLKVSFFYQPHEQRVVLNFGIWPVIKVENSELVYFSDYKCSGSVSHMC